MTFDDLKPGDAVFVDANVFTYHFQPHPVWGAASRRLLQKVEQQQLAGFTTTHVVGEVAHRLMTLEATVQFGWPFAGIGNRLRTNPASVQQLHHFRAAVAQIVQSRFQILAVTGALLLRAAGLCQVHGLLTNDGLIAAVMEANGISCLASGDTDFDRLPMVTRYAPG